MAKKKLKRLKKQKKHSLTQQGLLSTFIALLFYLFLYFTQSTFNPISLPGSEAPIELYSNQTEDDLTKLFVTAIKEAKDSVTLVIYALLDPSILSALRKKSEEGIPLWIVCDAKASPGITRHLPQAHIIRRASQGLTHQKILIIDQHLILLGSANMTTASLAQHGNLVIGVQSPQLAERLATKIKSMDEDTGSIPLSHFTTKVGSQTVELSMLPDDRNAAERIKALFRSAKKTIKVAMFTWTRKDFAEELMASKKRGVEVEVILDRYSGKGASAKIIRLLQQASIPVRLSTGHGLLHHKFAYIDQEILINGSANWTHSAFNTNDDCFLILYPLTQSQIRKMENLWQALKQHSEPTID